MGDDRILLLPPAFAFDPVMVDLWRGFRTLIDQLEAHFPVDLFHWSPEEGQVAETPEQVIDLIEGAIRPQHHVVDLGTACQMLLVALTRRPARSLTTAGLFSSAATLEAAGEFALAAALTAVTALAITPAQIVPLAMEGAAPRDVETAIAAAELGIERANYHQLLARFHETDFTGRTTVDIPVLCLDVPFPTPGADRLFELFKESIPNARRDELLIWPMRMQEAAGGRELAGKVIAFIQSVIAERGKVGG
ncbi:MAG: hypothetical protein WEB00_09275 [Dehalococcoidia bacterium]